MKKIVQSNRRAALATLEILSFASLLFVTFATEAAVAIEAPPLVPNAPGRLPEFIDGRPVLPDIGCFWSFNIEGENYKNMIDKTKED